jgi:hypothetical protein
MTEDQNTIVYILFLNGILFLGLNFVANAIVFPGERDSKVRGYMFIVAVITAFSSQQEFRGLVALGFATDKVQTVLLMGFIVPTFLLSLVYYRFKKNRILKERYINESKEDPDGHN